MSHKAALAILAALIAVTFVLGYSMAGAGAGWVHLVGLGLTVCLLVVIATGRVPGFSRRPPD
jgi:hypothetical protein